MFDTQELVLKLHQLKQQNNQTIESFGHSYLTQLEILSYHDIKIGSVKDLAFRFLVCLNMPKLFKDQIKDIDKFSSWWKHKTLQEFIDKADREYEAEKRLGSLDSAYIIQSNNNDRKDGNSNASNKHQNTSNKQQSQEKAEGNQGDGANPRQERPPSHLQPLAISFKQELEADKSMTGSRATLFKWHHDNYNKCCFHNNTQSHNILQCYVTARICRETGNSNLLQEFQSDNLPTPASNEPTSNAHPVCPPGRNPYNTNPTNHPAPVRNPYLRRPQPPRPPTNPPNIHARMARIINERVEQETNARMAEYIESIFIYGHLKLFAL